jgi:lipopolysaccharide/colanic/teichoic acid biosynthesis glycosyltransferase
VTGLAQVRYRNEAPWSVRIEADLEYVERLSLALDVQIGWRTLHRVIRAGGVRMDQTPDQVDDLGESTEREEMT